MAERALKPVNQILKIIKKMEMMLTRAGPLIQRIGVGKKSGSKWE